MKRYFIALVAIIFVAVPSLQASAEPAPRAGIVDEEALLRASVADEEAKKLEANKVAMAKVMADILSKIGTPQILQGEFKAESESGTQQAKVEIEIPILDVIVLDLPGASKNESGAKPKVSFAAKDQLIKLEIAADKKDKLSPFDIEGDVSFENPKQLSINAGVKGQGNAKFEAKFGAKLQSVVITTIDGIIKVKCVGSIRSRIWDVEKKKHIDGDVPFEACDFDFKKKTEGEGYSYKAHIKTKNLQ